MKKIINIRLPSVLFPFLLIIFSEAGVTRKDGMWFQRGADKGNNSEEKLFQDNPEIQKKIDLAYSYFESGELYKIQGDMVTALEFLGKCIWLYEELCRDNPGDDYLKESLIFAYESMGDLYNSRGNCLRR